MRVRLHADIAKKVNAARKGIRDAATEVNMALAIYYSKGIKKKK